MSISTRQLNDDRYVGLYSFEIASFPNTDGFGRTERENVTRLSKAFSGVLQEFHRIGHDGNTSLELLWITEKAENQTFFARVRIFIVIRRIDTSKEAIELIISSIQKSMIATLSSQHFEIDSSEIAEKELDELIKTVNDSCLFSISKNEKVSGTTASPYLYYYPEVAPSSSFDNFEALITTLSQYDGCCVAFQIFPESFKQDEIYMINESCTQLANLASGMQYGRQMYRDPSAVEPYKALSYYLSRVNSPVFSYNILVFGSRPACASISAKVVSLLQSGEEKIGAADFKCTDLSGENVRLRYQFPAYLWNINTKQVYYLRNADLINNHAMAKTLFRLPYLMASEEACAFFRLPLWSPSISAIRSNVRVVQSEQFDKEVVNETNVRLGTLVASEGRKIPIACPDSAFTKHSLIVGTPGMGKTTFSINLLLQFARREIPFLAIEPTKTEYRAMIDILPDLQIFTPGNNSVSPFIINPFIPPKGVRIEQYIPGLASAFKAAFSMPSPLDILFLKAVRNCYMEHGWKDYNVIGDEGCRVFGLYDFILTFKQLVSNSTYSAEVKGNIESGGVFRLSNLIEQNSNIYDTVNTIPVEDILSKPTVLELNSIENPEQKSLIMALLLISICIYTKHNTLGDGNLKNILLVDEAHVLLDAKQQGQAEKADSQESTIKALQDMIAEIRSYGTGIVIADQTPSRVSRPVIANTDIKVAFRLVEPSEKQLIANSINMDTKAMQQLSLLKPGEAYAFYGRLETPQLLSTENTRETENIRLVVGNEEIAERMKYWEGKKDLLRPYTECANFSTCKKDCDFFVRADAEHYALRIYERYKDKMTDVGKAAAYVQQTEKLLAGLNPDNKDQTNNRLINCIKLKLLRRIQMEKSFKFNPATVKAVLEKEDSKNMQNVSRTESES